ncbi:hypothetical protein D3C78_1541650 [compost metagenome]
MLPITDTESIYGIKKAVLSMVVPFNFILTNMAIPRPNTTIEGVDIKIKYNVFHSALQNFSSSIMYR